MVRKYIILAVMAALLSPCLLTFADDDLQGQLDDVQNRMAEQSEKKLTPKWSSTTSMTSSMKSRRTWKRRKANIRL